MYGIAQPIGLLVRMLAVLLLVAGSYNPSGYSYYHWAFQGSTDYWAVKLLLGLLIIFGYVFCVAATVRSLRFLLGVPLLLVLASALWLMSNEGWLDLSDWLERTLALEAVVVIVLATGVSFSLIRYRLSGQLDSRTLTY